MVRVVHGGGGVHGVAEQANHQECPSFLEGGEALILRVGCVALGESVGDFVVREAVARACCQPSRCDPAGVGEGVGGDGGLVGGYGIGGEVAEDVHGPHSSKIWTEN